MSGQPRRPSNLLDPIKELVKHLDQTTGISMEILESIAIQLEKVQELITENAEKTDRLMRRTPEEIRAMLERMPNVGVANSYDFQLSIKKMMDEVLKARETIIEIDPCIELNAAMFRLLEQINFSNPEDSEFLEKRMIPLWMRLLETNPYFPKTTSPAPSEAADQEHKVSDGESLPISDRRAEVVHHYFSNQWLGENFIKNYKKLHKALLLPKESSIIKALITQQNWEALSYIAKKSASSFHKKDLFDILKAEPKEDDDEDDLEKKHVLLILLIRNADHRDSFQNLSKHIQRENQNRIEANPTASLIPDPKDTLSSLLLMEAFYQQLTQERGQTLLPSLIEDPSKSMGSIEGALYRLHETVAHSDLVKMRSDIRQAQNLLGQLEAVLDHIDGAETHDGARIQFLVRIFKHLVSIYPELPIPEVLANRDEELKKTRAFQLELNENNRFIGIATKYANRFGVGIEAELDAIKTLSTTRETLISTHGKRIEIFVKIFEKLAGSNREIRIPEILLDKSLFLSTINSYQLAAKAQKEQAEARRLASGELGMLDSTAQASLAAAAASSGTAASSTSTGEGEEEKEGSDSASTHEDGASESTEAQNRKRAVEQLGIFLLTKENYAQEIRQLPSSTSSTKIHYRTSSGSFEDKEDTRPRRTRLEDLIGCLLSKTNGAASKNLRTQIFNAEGHLDSDMRRNNQIRILTQEVQSLKFSRLGNNQRYDMFCKIFEFAGLSGLLIQNEDREAEVAGKLSDGQIFEHNKSIISSHMNQLCDSIGLRRTLTKAEQEKNLGNFVAMTRTILNIIRHLIQFENKLKPALPPATPALEVSAFLGQVPAPVAVGNERLAAQRATTPPTGDFSGIEGVEMCPIKRPEAATAAGSPDPDSPQVDFGHLALVPTPEDFRPGEPEAAVPENPLGYDGRMTVVSVTPGTTEMQPRMRRTGQPGPAATPQGVFVFATAATPVIGGSGDSSRYVRAPADL